MTCEYIRWTTTSPHSQTINYLTYDHINNKLETDVSFQFNIDVSGVNHDSRQFPYTDICENFIEITKKLIVWVIYLDLDESANQKLLSFIWLMILS